VYKIVHAVKTQWKIAETPEAIEPPFQQPMNTYSVYSGASVYELNPFLEAVLKPKCS
jgi:hypothetical protein